MNLRITLLRTCLGLAIPLGMAGQAKPDFNGDGYADLAIGSPNEVVNGKGNAGAVNVIYGSAAGLAAAGNQLWHQDTRGIRGTAQTNDRFGSALAGGDFNGDGFSDLAIGVPGEGGGYPWGSGGVNVMYGSASGLTARGNQFWSQDSPGVVGVAQEYDAFGSSLAAGDFNGDGYADLAIGVPGESIGDLAQAGGVNILYGSADGLTSRRNQFWSQDSEGILGSAEAYDQFGWSLAAANFGLGSMDDLAIGVPYEDVGGVVDAGAVNVLYGSVSGLVAAGDQLWHQDSEGIEDAAQAGDFFGWSLAAANFGGTSHADLAIGVPFEDEYLFRDQGSVNVIYGSADGLTSTGNHVLNPLVTEFAEFGHSLAAGNFNGGDYADLAVGAPIESNGNGVVCIFYGSAGGLATGADAWLFPYDRDTDFGWSLSGADYGGDGSYDDLAVGAPRTQVNGQHEAGAVRVFYGSRNGPNQSQFWSQDSNLILGVAEAGDRFGDSLPGRTP